MGWGFWGLEESGGGKVVKGKNIGSHHSQEQNQVQAHGETHLASLVLFP